MWGIKSCAWVRDRLPLLAGGDPLGLDRRPVERHLVRCVDCRRRLSALADTVDVLRALGARDAVDDVGPSLWPALARQIQESRHARWAFGFEGWSWAWPSVGLAAGLLIALGFVGLVPSAPTDSAGRAYAMKERRLPILDERSPRVYQVSAEDRLVSPDQASRRQELPSHREPTAVRATH